MNYSVKARRPVEYKVGMMVMVEMPLVIRNIVIKNKPDLLVPSNGTCGIIISKSDDMITIHFKTQDIEARGNFLSFFIPISDPDMSVGEQRG